MVQDFDQMSMESPPYGRGELNSPAPYKPKLIAFSSLLLGLKGNKENQAIFNMFIGTKEESRHHANLYLFKNNKKIIAS